MKWLIKFINFFGIKTRAQKQKEFADMCDAYAKSFEEKMKALGMKQYLKIKNNE